MNEEEKSAFVGNIPELIQEVFGPQQAFWAELTDYNERCRVLSRDVATCNGPLKESGDNQFWRRTVVKNIFAFLEASAFGFKRIAFHLFQQYEIDFSSAEIAMLLEEKYALLENGEVKTTDKNFQRFIPNLKFAFKCFAKANGLSYKLDVSQVPLKEFEELRNRITHPKKSSELLVTDEELKIAHRIWTWLSAEQMKIVSGAQLPRTVKFPPMPKTRLGVTKDYIVMCLDGNVFQFDTEQSALAFKEAHTPTGAVVKPVLVKRSELPP